MMLNAKKTASLALPLLLASALARAEPPSHTYVEVGSGRLQLAGRDFDNGVTLKGSLALGDWGFLRGSRREHDSAALDIDRSEVEFGLRWALGERFELSAAVGVERLQTQLFVQSDFLEQPEIIRVRRESSGPSLQFGLHAAPLENLGINLTVAHHDRERDYWVALPRHTMELQVEYRFTPRFSVVASAASGEDYREYLLGPRLSF